MDKKVDTISFGVGTYRFEGQINMRRNGKSLDSKTTFFGVCSGPPQCQHFHAEGDNIDDVRRSLYEQASDLYGAKNWEKWVLIVVYTDNDRDWDIDEKRGMDAPRMQDLQVHVKVTRYLRSEVDGKEIWSDYYKKIPKPEVDTIEGQEEGHISFRDKYVGALLPDDERTRAFIERMKQGFNALEQQMKSFLAQGNIQQSIDRALAASDMLLLEAPSDDVQRQED